MRAPNTGLPLQPPWWVAAMNRQTEIARKLAAELALPPAQRSRAGVAPPPRGGGHGSFPDDKWSI